MSTQTTVEMDFGAILREALQPRSASQKLHHDHLERNGLGATIQLPWSDKAALGWDAVGASEVGRQPDYLVDSDDPLFDLLSVVVVTSVKGSLPLGSLPTAAVIGANDTQSSGSDPAVTSLSYSLSRIAECKSSYSTELALQSPDFGSYVESSQLAAIRKTVLTQVLAGDASGVNVQGLEGLAGVHEATYTPSTGPGATTLTGVEKAVVDAGAVASRLVWVFGHDVDDHVNDAVITPGDHRRIVERGRVTLSGARAIRSPKIAATTALCIDPCDRRDSGSEPPGRRG